MTKFQNSQSAKPMHLTYPRLKARQLLLQFSGSIAMDRRLSGAPSGTAHRDLRNWSNSWMKSIALERPFLLNSFGCWKEVSRDSWMRLEKRQGWRKRRACSVQKENALSRSDNNVCNPHNEYLGSDTRVKLSDFNLKSSILNNGETIKTRRCSC